LPWAVWPWHFVRLAEDAFQGAVQELAKPASRAAFSGNPQEIPVILNGGGL
jgi:hypothetical protein